MNQDNVYQFIRNKIRSTEPLTEKTFESMKQINDNTYQVTLLDDIPVCIYNLEKEFSGTNAFLVQGGNGFGQNWNKVVFTESELCRAFIEAMALLKRTIH